MMDHDSSIESILKNLKRKALSKLGSVERYVDVKNNLEHSELQLLVNELQTYHIELEIQNSELRHSQQELLEANDIINELYDYTPVGYLTIDSDSVILKCNLTLSCMLGIERSELLDTHFSSYILQDDSDQLSQALADINRDGKRASCEVRMTRHVDPEFQMAREPIAQLDSGQFWGQIDTVPVEGLSDDESPQYRIVLLDITERKLNETLEREHQAQQQKLLHNLSYQATHDSLTGLVNRSEFQRRLERLLKDARGLETGAVHALCYIDLDQFKVVNDTCGHVAGDELLRQLSQAIVEHIRQRDTVARLGGDEFAVIMEHCSIEDAQRFAESLRVLIEEFQFCWERKTFKLSASFGLIPINPCTGAFDQLLKNADTACYIAKEQGRNRIHVYHEKDEEASLRLSEMKWVTRIKQSIDEDLFTLMAQPIVATRDGKDGKKDNKAHGRHFELLIRMLDKPEHVIPPGAFLGAAERFSLASKIDAWVVKTVFRKLAQAPKFQSSLGMCSINLSGLSITDKEFFEFVQAELTKSGVDGSKICFEITETAAISNMILAKAFITGLKKRGCKFALDDFGCGLSSFAYLKKLPIDYVKVDGLFVRGIADDPIDYAMVKSIVSVSQALGKETIAEYVENDEVFTKLKEIGVDYVQGSYTGMPSSFTDYIKSA